MPTQQSHAEGVVIAKLLLGMVSAAGTFYFQTSGFAPIASDVLLCAAVFVGQAEKRPMTAGKLATYIGMPRGTVARKLQELEQAGILERIDGGRWIVAVTGEENAQRTLNAIAAFKQLVKKAAADLSKLDT